MCRTCPWHQNNRPGNLCRSCHPPRIAQSWHHTRNLSQCIQCCLLRPRFALSNLFGTAYKIVAPFDRCTCCWGILGNRMHRRGSPKTRLGRLKIDPPGILCNRLALFLLGTVLLRKSCNLWLGSCLSTYPLHRGIHRHWKSLPGSSGPATCTIDILVDSLGPFCSSTGRRRTWYTGFGHWKVGNGPPRNTRTPGFRLLLFLFHRICQARIILCGRLCNTCRRRIQHWIGRRRSGRVRNQCMFRFWWFC